MPYSNPGTLVATTASAVSVSCRRSVAPRTCPPEVPAGLSLGGTTSSTVPSLTALLIVPIRMGRP